MEIIYFIIVLVIIFLIFILMKKIIIAFVSIFIIFIVTILSCGFLIYNDLNEISNSQNLEFNVLYLENDNVVHSVKIISDENKNLSFSSGDKNLEELEKEAVAKENIFIIKVERDFFERFLKDKKYNPLEEVQSDVFDIELTKQDIIDIIDKKKDISFFDFSFNGLSVEEMVFLYALQNSLIAPENYIKLLEYYKDDKIEILPKRFSFSLVKYVPTFWLEMFIDEKSFS